VVCSSFKGFKNPFFENGYWKLEELFDYTVLSPPFTVDPALVQSAIDSKGVSGHSDFRKKWCRLNKKHNWCRTWVEARSFKDAVESKSKYIRWSSVWNDLFTEFELKRLIHYSQLSSSADKYTYNHPTIVQLTSKAKSSAKGKLSSAIGVHLRTFSQYSWRSTFCEDNYLNHPLYQTLLCIMSTEQIVENVEYYQKVRMMADAQQKYYDIISFHQSLISLSLSLSNFSLFIKTSLYIFLNEQETEQPIYLAHDMADGDTLYQGLRNAWGDRLITLKDLLPDVNLTANDIAPYVIMVEQALLEETSFFLASYFSTASSIVVLKRSFDRFAYLKKIRSFDTRLGSIQLTESSIWVAAVVCIAACIFLARQYMCVRCCRVLGLKRPKTLSPCPVKLM
jgi:hypothetical protein